MITLVRTQAQATEARIPPPPTDLWAGYNPTVGAAAAAPTGSEASASAAEAAEDAMGPRPELSPLQHALNEGLWMDAWRLIHEATPMDIVSQCPRGSNQEGYTALHLASRMGTSPPACT